MKRLAIDRNFIIRKHYLTTPITASDNIDKGDYRWLGKASQLQMRRWWKIRSLR